MSAHRLYDDCTRFVTVPSSRSREGGCDRFHDHTSPQSNACPRVGVLKRRHYFCCLVSQRPRYTALSLIRRQAVADQLRVERQHGQLGRRTANEAVDEQEVFRLLGIERIRGVLASGAAEASIVSISKVVSGSEQERTSPPQTKNAFCVPGSSAGAITQSSSLRSRWLAQAR